MLTTPELLPAPKCVELSAKAEPDKQPSSVNLLTHREDLKKVQN